MLTGNITFTDVNTFTLSDIDAKEWDTFGNIHWDDKMYRVVTKNKKECTIQFNKYTKWINDEQICKAEDLKGLNVTVAATIKKYYFGSEEDINYGKQGFIIVADKVCGLYKWRMRNPSSAKREHRGEPPMY